VINFRRVFKALGPGWLTSGDGEKVLYSVGVMLDATLERARQALVARFPEYAETEDALGYLGRDRLIIRGRNESAARYAKRLVEWRYPLGHRVRGNAYAMLRQIRAYFLDQTAQFTVDRRGTWHAIDAAGNETRASDTGAFFGGDDLPETDWARFWLGIDRPPGWSYPSQLLGDPDLWGGVLTEDSEYVIGLDGATQSDIQALRAIARDWKMAGSNAEYLYVLLQGGLSTWTVSGYISAPTTNWVGFGGDFAAWNNAATVVIKLT
jgi:hypothetical protein